MAQVELKTRLYTIKINPITGLVDAPKKMFFYRTDAETSVLQIQSTEELPTGSVASLTCIKKNTQSIVTMTSTVGTDNKTFICGLLSQFTSTSDTLTCELKITQETDKVTTFPSFTILVNPSIVDGVEGGQDPVEETTLSNLIAEVNDALSNVSEVIQGADGRGITSISKTGTNGLVDTYTITYTDATTSTFTVTNGKDGVDGTNGTDGRGIVSITKTSTSGLVDTYTILYTDETTSTFTVTNGKDGSGGGGTGSDGRGITSITKTGTEGLVDTYTITYTDDTTSTFTVTNGEAGADGRGIVSVGKTSTNGLVDTYTITYTDETTSTFTVTNGKDGADGSSGGGTGETLYNFSDFSDTAKYTGLIISKSSPSSTDYPVADSLSRRCFKVTLSDPLTAWQNYNDLFFVFGRLANLYYNNNLSTTSLTNKYKGKLYARIEFSGIKGSVAEPTLETYTTTKDYEIMDFPKCLLKKPYYNFVFELKLDKANNIVQLFIHQLECHTSTVAFSTDEAPQTVEGGSTLLMSFKMNGKNGISMMIKSITLYFFNEAENGTDVLAGQFDSTTNSYQVKFCGKIES